MESKCVRNVIGLSNNYEATPISRLPFYSLAAYLLWVLAPRDYTGEKLCSLNCSSFSMSAAPHFVWASLANELDLPPASLTTYSADARARTHAHPHPHPHTHTHTHTHALTHTCTQTHARTHSNCAWIFKTSVVNTINKIPIGPQLLFSKRAY